MIGGRAKERIRETAPWRRLRIPALAPPRLRSLTLKLTLAFLFVGLIGATLVALFVSQRTQRAVDQFVVDRGRKTLIADLTQFYQTHGSWEGVAGMAPDRAAQTGGGDGPPIVLVAADGRVVLGNTHYPVGTLVSERERAGADPITVNGAVAGWLLSGFRPRGPGAGSPEANLIARIYEAITFSAIGATAIALLLGVLLARTLTQPIRQLTEATRVVAKGALGQQVEVRSQDELGALAASFNRMSADLAQASTLRRQMTADIAHDLRTPLSVILGYTEALRDGKLPAEQDIFETLYTEAQHLQHLVDDLRTLSLADAGELALTRQHIAPRALLERAAAAYRAQAEDRQVTLAVHSTPAVPDVDVDPERVAQVLGNLLGNALRYTPPGGTITLDATARDGAVQIRVEDTGTGIAPGDLPHVFERFYRVDPSRHQSDGSSGLGLAIAKSIVEAHGGNIAVASVLGQGTTFTLHLPIAQAEPAPHRG
jgi:signal transduction histidine kinase